MRRPLRALVKVVPASLREAEGGVAVGLLIAIVNGLGVVACLTDLRRGWMPHGSPEKLEAKPPIDGTWAITSPSLTIRHDHGTRS